MYDRIVFGYVRDMIHALPRWPNLFPWIFNVADSMLCVGVFLLIVYSLLHKPREDHEPPRRGFEVVKGNDTFVLRDEKGGPVWDWHH